IHALFDIDGKKLSWDKYGPVASRTMMWLADSPPHGYQVFNIDDDNYPNYYREEWELLIKEMSQKQIKLTITQLNRYNDRASDKLKELCATYKTDCEIIDISEHVKGHNFNSSEGYSKISKKMSSYMTEKTTHYVSSRYDDPTE